MLITQSGYCIAFLPVYEMTPLAPANPKGGSRTVLLSRFGSAGVSCWRKLTVITVALASPLVLGAYVPRPEHRKESDILRAWMIYGPS